MITLKRPILWTLWNQRKIYLCSSKIQRFDSLLGTVCQASSYKQSHRRQKERSSELKPKGNFKEQPRWIVKMHGSLLSDVGLPPPLQGRAVNQPRHLPSCSLDDLLSLVWEVSWIDSQATALLIEMWRRMDSMDVEQIISVADIFFINKVHSTWYLGAMTVHLTEIMDSVKFTPSQLTRLALHALDQRRSTPPGFCLALENSILGYIDSLSLNQLAIICHSFFTSQTRIRSMDLLDKISIKLIQDFDTLNNWYLPVMMKTMRFSNFIKISFYRDMGDLLIKKNYLEKFYTLAQTMHIAHAYASVRISHPELFSYILQTCGQSRYKFRLKDLSKLIWACGTLVTDNAKDIAAIKNILTYVEHNVSLEEALHHPDNLVDLINGLCILDIHSDYLLNILFHPRHVTAVIGMGKGNEKFPQLSIIDHSVGIEHPSYTGNRLDEEAKETVLTLLGSFPVEKEMSIKKGLRQAVEALTELFGKDKVSCAKFLPHFQSSDIFLNWDTLESQFTRHDEVDCSSGQETGRYIRLAVLILSNMQTSYDGKPLGMLHMKLRQLKTLGYMPVLVDAEDALCFVYGDSKTTQDLLLQKLSHALGTDLAHISFTHE